MKIKYPLILASQSPRRIQLLNDRGFNPIIRPANIDEDLDPMTDPRQTAAGYAAEKARVVMEQVRNQEFIVLGCDTIVVIDDQVLGKPRDPDQAAEYLKCLSNRWHTVLTGICVALSHDDRSITQVVETQVRFRELSLPLIGYYLDHGHPLDKAGAYGIQDWGAFFIDEIKGCFFNVMGLPLNVFLKSLEILELIDWN
ncbi:MAG: septum formation protein Maf [Candidatus Delongbacteria bacterium]|nr:septum formation protein Maf [Candidatus Delongbacteria bacterium]